MGEPLEKIKFQLPFVLICIALTISAFSVFPLNTISGKADDGSLAFQYLTDLSKFGSRDLSRTGHQKAAAYIEDALTEMGYTPEHQKFVTEEGFNAANIYVEKPGKSNRMILVGAHFDSVATGSGVDDNGSGVAVLLEMAKRLKDQETPYSLRFIFFDAEETGLEGSEEYVSEMDGADIHNTAAMINVDSLAVGDNTYIYGSKGREGAIRDWGLAYANQQGYDLITQPGKNPKYPAGTTVDESDHAPFLHKGIQYAYFEATNWSLGNLDGYTQVDPSYGVEGEIWHTGYDRLDYITNSFPGRLESHLQVFSNVLFHILTEYHE
jgi:alkaline phosphatase isozyme conversion protein